MNNSVDGLFRRFDYFHEKNKSINNFIETVILSQNNFAKKSNLCVFYITVFVIQELNNETQILLKKAQRQNVFLTILIYRKNRSKDNKMLQNVRIEKGVQTVFAETNRFMSKNFIQNFSRIIEKHVEKLIEIELIKILNYNSTVIVDASIEFRIIITILQKIVFFSAKMMISCCSFNIDKTK